MVSVLYKPMLAVVAVVAGCLIATESIQAQQASDAPLLSEEFDELADGTAIGTVAGWEAFRGFEGQPPAAVVRAGLGRNGSHALTVSHDAEYRSDAWGITRQLKQPLSDGVVWIDCYFHPPGAWIGNLYLDARAGRATVARLAGEQHRPQGAKQPALRCHAAWQQPSWRTYRDLPLAEKWYRLTMRLDLDGGTYAAWVDQQPLGEELPLCSREPVDRIFLGLGGTADSPARLDDLRISRQPPEGCSLRELLPQPEAGLQFRLAITGDPQLGFGGYEADKARFAQAVEQINRSGAALTLVLGDMVHDADDENVYRDVKDLAGKLKGPVYFVRGNHERLPLYQKHFHPKADFAFTHQDWRFVFLDAIGNQSGLSDEQLAFVEEQFTQANQAGQEIVLCLHVSPWQDNERGRSVYNQIGPGRDRLVELIDKHRVLLCLSGHYHRGLWRHQQQATQYLTLGGTAVVRGGWQGWCLMDVYPDRVVIYEKPLHFAYVRADDKAFYNSGSSTWVAYEQAQKQTPYLQQGPIVIRRNVVSSARP